MRPESPRKIGSCNVLAFDNVCPIQGEWSFPRSCKLSDEGRDFFRKLLVVDPAERMTAAEALQHPWLEDPSQNSAVHLPTVQTSITSFRASVEAGGPNAALNRSWAQLGVSSGNPSPRPAAAAAAAAADKTPKTASTPAKSPSVNEKTPKKPTKKKLVCKRQSPLLAQTEDNAVVSHTLRTIHKTTSTRTLKGMTTIQYVFIKHAIAAQSAVGRRTRGEGRGIVVSPAHSEVEPALCLICGLRAGATTSRVTMYTSTQKKQKAFCGEEGSVLLPPNCTFTTPPPFTRPLHKQPQARCLEMQRATTV